MVPDPTFTSYYGRAIVKPSPWENDIPAYLFAGGLAAGSSLIAAGADLTGRPTLRRSARLGAIAALSFSMVALIHDLGKPSRFLNMLRVAKLTSPMSVGTWILSLYGPFAGAVAATEVVSMLPPRYRVGPLRLAPYVDRPAGLLAALFAPPVASYTAVLLADTATPSWHSAYKELPFVFVGSAAAASAGLGLVTSPVHETGPVRRMALGGAVLELVMEHRMEQTMGVTAEPLHQGKAGRLMRAAKVLTIAGAAGSVLAGRSRTAAVLSGGSPARRFGMHPVRGLRGGPGVGEGPEVHRGPAARAGRAGRGSSLRGFLTPQSDVHPGRGTGLDRARHRRGGIATCHSLIYS